MQKYVSQQRFHSLALSYLYCLGLHMPTCLEQLPNPSELLLGADQRLVELLCLAEIFS